MVYTGIYHVLIRCDPRLPKKKDTLCDRRRHLIAWSFFHPQDPTRIVDIVITHDLSKLRVKRVRSGKQILPVLDVSDLIAMKRAGGRPQDLEDIRALQELQK